MKHNIYDFLNSEIINSDVIHTIIQLFHKYICDFDDIT